MKLNSVFMAVVLLFYSEASLSSECVILLHGLARTASSMSKLEKSLEQHGYKVANIDYPSRKMKIGKLAELAVSAGIAKCGESNASPLNFVTHSLV